MAPAKLQQAPDTSSLEHRITTVEVDVSNLARGMRELVDNAQTNATEFRGQFAQIMERINSHNRINWPMVVSCFMLAIAGSGLLLSLVGILGSLSLAPIRAELGRLTADQQLTAQRTERLRELEIRLAQIEARENMKAEILSKEEKSREGLR